MVFCKKISFNLRLPIERHDETSSDTEDHPLLSGKSLCTRRKAKTMKIQFKWNSLTGISIRLSDFTIVFGVMWLQEKRVEDHLVLSQKLLTCLTWCGMMVWPTLHGNGSKIVNSITIQAFIAMQMGQNIAITMSSERSTTPNWADAAIHPWYAEVEHMDCRHVIKFKNFEAANRQTIRHFTQLIWARTKAVGCAAIGYTNYATPGTPFRVMYVCNYSPPGNIIGQPVYEVDSSIPSCREE